MKEGFSRFLGARPGRLHAAAHSHHPWPDVTFDAHARAWEDAASLMDDKWDHVFESVLPQARRRVARVLGLAGPDSLVFAPNTHEFVVRIASTLPAPFRVLTTDSEFHSFARQLARWEEEGMAVATRVSAEPFDSFPDRFVDSFDDHDLVFFSHVHFNSAYVTEDLDELVSALGDRAVIVVDGYHGFMALPTDLGDIADRAFYLAGGYKYAMAGEGVCFLHVPGSAPARPANTGWFAGFGELTDGQQGGVAYSSGGQRFAGATFDPAGVYRLDAVLGWLEDEQVTVEAIHDHVRSLQRRLLEALPAGMRSRLVPEENGRDRGNFLTFRRADAGDLYRRMHERDIITDYRADRWRIGLGIYHDADDIDRLGEIIHRLA